MLCQIITTVFIGSVIFWMLYFLISYDEHLIEMIFEEDDTVTLQNGGKAYGFENT
jgi:hypothetical protein